jgi:hypothetical protein
MTEFDIHLHLCEVGDHDPLSDEELSDHHWHHVSHPFEAPSVPHAGDLINLAIVAGVGELAWMVKPVQFIEWQAIGSELVPHVYMEQIDTTPSGYDLDAMTALFVDNGWKDEDEDDETSFFGMSMN